LLKAVEDANKINQDNTTLIVIDIKEQVVHETLVISEQKSVEPALVVDIKVKAEYKEPRSYKGLVWLVIIILQAPVGYFARQKFW
jgi:hypothetical protein